MDYTVIWTDRALDELAAAVRYIDYTGKPNRKMCSLYMSLLEKAGLKLDKFGDSKEKLDL